jgi:ABC-type transporter Mla maintaining outer membrane lipid asymmetry permease subunit MlaE
MSMKTSIFTIAIALIITMSGCTHTKASVSTGKSVVSKNVTK